MADPTSSISEMAGGGATTTLGAAELAYGMYLESQLERPVYQIPEEIKQNLTQAQQQALQGLPEEQKKQYIENLQRGSAQALSASQSRKGGLAGITALGQQQNQGYAQMLSMDAQARRENQRALMQQRGVMADYKDQAFQFNQVNPYYEKLSEAQALQGAGMQNISQGFQAGNTGGSGGIEKSSQQPQQNQQVQPVYQSQPKTYEMSPYQTGGIYQYTAPAPGSGQTGGTQELDMTGASGTGYW